MCPCGGRCHHSPNPCSLDCLAAALATLGAAMAGNLGARPPMQTTLAPPMHIVNGGPGVLAPPAIAGGQAPACPIHLVEMVFRPGGSKMKDGRPVTWPAFYSCARRDCRETVEIEGG